jgi:hypothetical protein
MPTNVMGIFFVCLGAAILIAPMVFILFIYIKETWLDKYLTNEELNQALTGYRKESEKEQ